MKKNLLKIVSILALGLISVSASAQGVWKASGTEAAIPVSTETGFGITGLTCMHSDVTVIDDVALTGVRGRTDAVPAPVPAWKRLLPFHQS